MGGLHQITKSWDLVRWCDGLNVSSQIHMLKHYPQCIFPPSLTLWKRFHLDMLHNATQITLSFVISLFWLKFSLPEPEDNFFF